MKDKKYKILIEGNLDVAMRTVNALVSSMNYPDIDITYSPTFPDLLTSNNWFKVTLTSEEKEQ